MNQLLQPEAFTLRQYKHGAWRTISDVITTDVAVTVSWEGPGIVPGSCRILGWPERLEEAALGHVLLEQSGNEPWATTRTATVTWQNSTVGSQHLHVALSAPHAPQPQPAPPSWKAENLLAAMQAFISGPGLWNDTGCFHRAGIYCPQRETLLFRAEDIGRHNCIDRLAGWAALNGVGLEDKVLLLSSRITNSMCTKVLKAGFRFMVNRSAVTTGAVEQANAANATVAGFARHEEGRFTVFADKPGRIL